MISNMENKIQLDNFLDDLHNNNTTIKRILLVTYNWQGNKLYMQLNGKKIFRVINDEPEKAYNMALSTLKGKLLVGLNKLDIEC